MSNPCDADILVGKPMLRWYSFLKWIVFAMLGTLLLSLLARSCQYASIAAPTLAAPAGALAPGVLNLGGSTEANLGKVRLEVADASGNIVCCEDNDAQIVDGQWSVQTGALTAGKYTATAYSVDPDGTKQTASTPLNLSIGATAVTLPDADTSAATGDSGNDATTAEDSSIPPAEATAVALDIPTLSIINDLVAPGAVTLNGSATPDSQVEVDLNGVRLGVVDVDSSGEWALRTDKLETGDYSVIAHAVDASGRRQAASEAMAWTVGGLAMTAPTLTLPEGNVDPSAVTVTGSGEPGTVVELLQNGDSVGTAVVGDDGRWSIDTTVERYLSEFEAVGLTDDGSEIGRSSNDSLAIPSAAAALTFSESPQFGDFSADTDGNSKASFVWSGRGEPGSDVQAFASGVVGPFATATVAQDGFWVIEEDAVSLPPGDYDISARMKAADGVALSSAIGSQITVPTVGEAASSGVPRIRYIEGGTDPLDPITIVGSAAPNEPVTLGGGLSGSATADNNGMFIITANPRPGASEISVSNSTGSSEPSNINLGASGIGVAVGTVDTQPDGAFTISGRAPADTSVEIYVDGVAVGRADADENGRFTFDGTADQGAHEVRVQVPAENGDVTISSAPAAMMIGDGAAAIAINEISGGSSQVQFFGAAAPNAAVQMVVDGTVVDVVTARADGGWDYGGSYSDGQHTIEAREFNPTTGRIVISSAEKPFTIENGQVLGSNGGLLRVVFADSPDGGTRTQALDKLDDAGYISGAPAIHVLLDSSYSMRLNLNGGQRLEVTDFDARINIAKRTLQSTISALPANVPFSLRAFGHIENTATTTCQTALEIPVQPLNRDAALATLGPIRPQFDTDTPLAESIALTATDLDTVRDRETVMVILTDGEETCGGDPTAAVQGLLDQGFQFRLFVVGLSINDPEVIGRFQRLAELGNGRYYPAGSADEVDEALAEALLTKYRVLNADGFEVAQGNVGGNSIQLAPGEYTVLVDGPDPRAHTLTVMEGRTAVALIE